MNTFSLQTRLYSGQGSLAVLKRFTNKHIWIICDGFLARSPLLDTLRNALPADNRISVFSEITPDPTIHTVVQGIAQMQALQPQVVIGFGGGSAMDAAKAIVWFSQQSGINIETCVAIPTTSGTGSEVTSACEADVIALVLNADAQWSPFSPGFTAPMNRPTIGLVTKADLAEPQRISLVAEWLTQAGARQIFITSALNNSGLDAVLDFLNSKEPLCLTK
ncbi:iron-containing alcohol dehydrogenase [Salmonella enterica]|nr:iron-containing alcohol dehydrogenase [Salmonella enterica]EGO1776634.1 iron-containing alcohol dehydrogenase [Salmonella enterica subsp. enterica serovar Enteritidis]EBB9695086.1 iron-containing alcohol dehydrogenase [Salmonella enterica]EGP2931787.1 iron-containing alcohol dehydrogenase [Salmonella enterica subsp. enterica serovar Enteritidis]EGX3718025.1 iron-containing alcohol dehydrogenase [Salmonella enterica]